VRFQAASLLQATYSQPQYNTQSFTQTAFHNPHGVRV
jgi:hypothetical protein